MLLLQSCGILIKSPTEIPAPDTVFIHDNPQPGDYAVIADDKDMADYRYEVFAVKGDKITIRYKANIHNAIGSMFKNMMNVEYSYLTITPEGKVLKSWIEGSDKKRYATPIAKKGEIGSLEKLTYISASKLRKNVSTTAGSFPVSGGVMYTAQQDFGLAKGHNIIFELHSDKVPFKMIYRENIQSAKPGVFLKSIEILTLAASGNLLGDYSDLYNELSGGDDSYQIKYQLIDYGFADKKRMPKK